MQFRTQDSEHKVIELATAKDELEIVLPYTYLDIG